MVLNKLNIVLIEDKKDNIKAAREQLKGHALKVFKTFSNFEEFLRQQITTKVMIVCPEKSLLSNSSPILPLSFAGYVNSLPSILLTKIDVLLTDNEIPVQPRRSGDNETHEKIGASIVLIGLMLKIPMIGLLTDRDHHNDSHSAVLDCLGGISEVPLSVGSSKVLFSSIHMVKSGEEKNSPKVKNWKAVLEILTTEK